MKKFKKLFASSLILLPAVAIAPIVVTTHNTGIVNNKLSQEESAIQNKNQVQNVVNEKVVPTWNIGENETIKKPLPSDDYFIDIPKTFDFYNDELTTSQLGLNQWRPFEKDWLYYNSPSAVGLENVSYHWFYVGDTIKLDDGKKQQTKYVTYFEVEQITKFENFFNQANKFSNDNKDIEKNLINPSFINHEGVDKNFRLIEVTTTNSDGSVSRTYEYIFQFNLKDGYSWSHNITNDNEIIEKIKKEKGYSTIEDIKEEKGTLTFRFFVNK